MTKAQEAIKLACEFCDLPAVQVGRGEDPEVILHWCARCGTLFGGTKGEASSISPEVAESGTRAVTHWRPGIVKELERLTWPAGAAKTLRPVAQARAWQQQMRQNNWTARELAAELNLGHSSVCQKLHLLRLPESVQARVDAGELSQTIACDISRLPDKDKMEYFANLAIRGKLQRKQVLERLRAAMPKRSKASKPATKADFEDDDDFDA